MYDDEQKSNKDHFSLDNQFCKSTFSVFYILPFNNQYISLPILLM